MNTQHSNKSLLAFSMIELLAIATIITLLAAFAIPAYLNQIAASKINSLWGLAQPAKLYVESQYLKQNTDVATITVAANSLLVTTSGDKTAQCITIQDGVVSVVGDPALLYDQVIWVAWTPSVAAGHLTWSCTYSSAAATYIAAITPNCTVGAAAYTADSACIS